MLRSLGQPRRAAIVLSLVLGFGVLDAQTTSAIKVWKVGSPHRGDTPSDAVPAKLAQEAGKRGLRIEVEAFPALGFAARFRDAVKRRTAPDLLVFDNFGILIGITTPLGGFVGIAQDAEIKKQLVQVTGSFDAFLGPQGGWTYLFAGSGDHRHARTLALGAPECPRVPRSQPLDGDLERVSRDVASGYVQNDAGRLLNAADPSRISGPPLTFDRVRSGDTSICGSWGNDKLAFVSVRTSYDGEKTIGQRPVLLVLRRLSSRWQLLTASRDPLSNSAFVNQIPSLTALLARDAPLEAPSMPAVLLSPPNATYPRPADGLRFGDFTWQPSASGDVIGEIAEFSYFDDARLFLRMTATAPGLRGSVQRVSAGELLSTRRDWLWRVWSIARTGDVTFSEVRTFPH